MESEERQGIIKVYWSQVRARVAQVEPHFARIVDELNPDKSFPLYLAYYPYGATDADTQSSLFPIGDGKYFRISDVDVPKDIKKHLGYSKDNTPLGMVLEKQIECYIDFKDKKRIIPWCIYTPGKMFPFTRILSKQGGRIYAPNGLLSSTAGSRSAFMLPNIGCATNHVNLQRHFKIKSSAPKSLYEHWKIFKELVTSKMINSDWRCCVMYFSENWLLKLRNDVAWARLKQYLHEIAWHESAFDINRIHYDMIFSIIQENRNLKPNPYLTDTAKHLFSIAMGASLGYAPALNEDALPVRELQKIFFECYGLKKYLPTIMSPVHYFFESDSFPIYYSLQNPSTLVFSPKSREASSTLTEMRELEHILKIFKSELSKSNGLCAPDSILYKISKNINFDFFHNKIDSHEIVKPSSQIFEFDTRFSRHCNSVNNPNASFATDAPFMRGCIRLNQSSGIS